MLQNRGKLMSRLALMVGILTVGMALALPVLGQGDVHEVIVIEVDGPVIPPMRSYIERGIQEAEASGAEALVVVLNTPGGSVTVTQAIVQSIRASRVPVIVYVGPRGAIAASAGTLITLAGHAAVMAPETAIGAASPISGQGEDLPPTIAAKIEEILSAQARGLAERRGEEAVALADAAITEAKAVSGSEALAVNFIDAMAHDVGELLDELDGFEVVVGGETIILRTANAVERTLERTIVERVLAVLVDPNLVFVLLTLGVVAIIVEISVPGGWLAGTVGVASLGTALYGLGTLPVNWLGIVLIVMAFVLFVLEVKAPSIGALTAGGVFSLIAGGILLFQTPAIQPFGRISIPIVILESLLIAAMFAFIARLGLRAQMGRVTTGAEGMLGQGGIVLDALEPQGTVLVTSERWRAISEGEALPVGAQVEVIGVDNFTLRVRSAVTEQEEAKKP